MKASPEVAEGLRDYDKVVSCGMVCVKINRGSASRLWKRIERKQHCERRVTVMEGLWRRLWKGGRRQEWVGSGLWKGGQRAEAVP